MEVALVPPEEDEEDEEGDSDEEEEEEEQEPEMVFTETWLRVKQKLEFINPRKYPVAAIKLLWKGQTLKDDAYICDTAGIKQESSVWAEIDPEFNAPGNGRVAPTLRCFSCREIIRHEYTDVPINTSLRDMCEEFTKLSVVYGAW
jgi:hypothetical protein